MYISNFFNRNNKFKYEPNYDAVINQKIIILHTSHVNTNAKASVDNKGSMKGRCLQTYKKNNI